LRLVQIVKPLILAFILNFLYCMGIAAV